MKQSKQQAWQEAKKKHHLSHETVQMAQKLGLNPKKLGKIDNHKQQPRHLYERQQDKSGG